MAYLTTDFARDNNVGAVAAKEEVWEVVAQLSGYALSIAVLAALDDIVRTSGVQVRRTIVSITSALCQQPCLKHLGFVEQLAYGI